MRKVSTYFILSLFIIMQVCTHGASVALADSIMQAMDNHTASQNEHQGDCDGTVLMLCCESVNGTQSLATLSGYGAGHEIVKNMHHSTLIALLHSESYDRVAQHQSSVAKQSSASPPHLKQKQHTVLLI